MKKPKTARAAISAGKGSAPRARFGVLARDPARHPFDPRRPTLDTRSAPVQHTHKLRRCAALPHTLPTPRVCAQQRAAECGLAEPPLTVAALQMPYTNVSLLHMHNRQVPHACMSAQWASLQHMHRIKRHHSGRAEMIASFLCILMVRRVPHASVARTNVDGQLLIVGRSVDPP